MLPLAVARMESAGNRRGWSGFRGSAQPAEREFVTAFDQNLLFSRTILNTPSRTAPNSIRLNPTMIQPPTYRCASPHPNCGADAALLRSTSVVSLLEARRP